MCLPIGCSTIATAHFDVCPRHFAGVNRWTHGRVVYQVEHFLREIEDSNTGKSEKSIGKENCANSGTYIHRRKSFFFGSLK